MDEGFKLKLFPKFGTLIDKIKNLGPNLKQGINSGLFYVISPKFDWNQV